MPGKESLVEILSVYNGLYPGDAHNSKPFAEYLVRNNDDQLYNRKNFDGHITTSAFIIDVESNEMLLLRHKSLNRWLQPGGHTEGDATLLASALREAMEETGIGLDQLVNIPVNENTDVPFDIDSHYIPPNPAKNEDGHFHHDLRYLFAYNGSRENIFNADEATGMQWVGFDSLSADDIFEKVVKKVLLTLASPAGKSLEGL